MISVYIQYVCIVYAGQAHMATAIYASAFLQVF